MEKTDRATHGVVVEREQPEALSVDRYLSCLQHFSAALGSAHTAPAVADALLSVGLMAFHPLSGAVYLLTEEGAFLEPIRAFDTSSPRSNSLPRVSINAPRPLAMAARQGQSLFLDSIPESESAAPEEAARQEARGALALLPLCLSGRVLGVLRVTSIEKDLLLPDMRAYLEAAAQISALALDRARWYEAERQAREIAEQGREKLEAEQRENETRAKDFFGNLTDGVLACEPQGQIKYANATAAEIVRLPVETLSGAALPELFPEFKGSAFEAACQQVMRDSTPVHREDYWPRYDAWFENHIFPTSTGFAILFRDITDRKQLERFQQAISDLFLDLANVTHPDRLLEAAVGAVRMALKADGGAMMEIDVAQDRAEVLYGAAAAPAPEGNYPLSGFLTPEGIACYQQGKTRVIADTAADTATGSIENARYLPLQLGAFVSVPFLRSGEWVGALLVWMRRPRVWRPQEIAFVEAVGERIWLSLENVRLYQAERERSHQLSVAISEVHHRVKNNLQAVSALLEMQIVPGTQQLPMEAVQDSLSQIKTIALVHDLLARDRPIGSVNVALVLTNLAELLSAGMRIGKQALAIRVEAETVWLSTKAATSLALVVNELLTNAAKHNEPIGGDGESRDNTEDAIEVTLHKQEGRVCVAVLDHGPGFTPDFDPVAAAHIGLELVLMLVEHDLQGSIAFSNRFEPGDGRAAYGARVEITFSEPSLPG